MLKYETYYLIGWREQETRVEAGLQTSVEEAGPHISSTRIDVCLESL